MARLSCSTSPIFFLIFVVPINSEATFSAGGVSVWPIWDLKDPKVLSIANFALANHNNTKIDKNLHLVNVVDGSYSVVKDGVERDYWVSLTILAKDNRTAQPQKYRASMFYMPLRKEHPIKATSFGIFKRILPGGIWPIDDLKAPRVVSVAVFAVAEYNKKVNTTLNFVSVVKGKRHAVGGSLYHLVILAKDSNNAYPKEYETAVLERLWLKKDPLVLEWFKNLSKSIFN